MTASSDIPASATVPLIVFDGSCRFCRSQIDRIRRRDVHRRFEYLPRQTEGLEQRYPQLAEGDFDTGMRLVHDDGSVSVGADAVYEISRHLRGWRWLAWLYRVPGVRAACRGAYAWVARRRHRLGGPCDESCRIDAGDAPRGRPGDDA